MRILAVSLCILLFAERLDAANHVWWTASDLAGGAGVITQGSPGNALLLSTDGQASSWAITTIYETQTSGATGWSLDYKTEIPGVCAGSETIPINDLNEYMSPGIFSCSPGFFARS